MKVKIVYGAISRGGINTSVDQIKGAVCNLVNNVREKAFILESENDVIAFQEPFYIYKGAELSQQSVVTPAKIINQDFWVKSICCGEGGLLEITEWD